MTNEPSHGRRVLEILRLVIDRPVEQRAELLDTHCGSDAELRCEVESLLDHDRHPWSALERAPVISSLNLEPIAPGAAEDKPPPASHIGRYRIVAQVGEGAMGVVYQAEQDYPKRQVALKLIRPGRHKRTLLRRFMREATTLGRLRHPGIAQIYDAGSDRVDGVEHPYLAMEFIEGPSLREFACRRPLAVRDCVQLIIRICEAVQHAHQQGVIHRDLKPENILVEQGADGPRPRVLDFGVAQLIDAEEPATLATEAGQLLGTLAYMSPEQVEGKSADTRMDVYALGVILYELLTGRLPIDVRNDTLLTALKRIREEPPRPLRQLTPGLRGDLEIIVATAMDKDPQRRYASAGELAADLRCYLACEPIQARKAGPLYRLAMFARRRRGLAAAVLLVFLTTLGGSAWGLHGLARANRALDDLSGMSAFLVADVVISLDQIAGTTEVRRRLLDRLQEQVEALLARRPRDRALLLAHAELLVQISDIDYEEGRYSDSLALRKMALGQRDRAAEIGGRDPEYETDYARNLVKIGDIYGGWKMARDWYERARVIHERLVDENPGMRRYLDDLSWSYGRLGILAMTSLRSDEAESFMLRRLEIVERMLAESPDDALVLHGLCMAHSQLAWLLANHRSDLQRALYHDEQAINAGRRVVQLAPFKRVYVGDVAEVMLSAAERLYGPGLYESAAIILREVAPIVEALQVDPDSQFVIKATIRHGDVFAQLAERRGELAAAFEIVNRMLQITLDRNDDYYFMNTRLKLRRRCAHLALRMGMNAVADVHAIELQAEIYATIDRFWNDPLHLKLQADYLAFPPVVEFSDPWTAIDIQRRVVELTDGASPREWQFLARFHHAAGQFKSAREALEKAHALATEQDSPLLCEIEDQLDVLEWG